MPGFMPPRGPRCNEDAPAGTGLGSTAASRYAPGVTRLLACPFCRQLYRAGETEGTCPECGVRLERMDKLPASLDGLAEEANEAEPVAPQDRPLPWTHVGRGRGVLGLLALLGLVAFFLPWIEMHMPTQESVTGFDLARHRLGWMWGGSAGWFITVPLVWSRRSIAQMRGVRVILAVFAAMTLVEVAVLLAFPPRASQLRALEFDWGAGLYLSALVSALGVAAALRFGGPPDRVGTLPSRGETHGLESSHGRTLH
jgi:hypothetical protein